jgi:uncharacterized protein YciI
LQHFLVTETPGPAWDHSRRRREQASWDEHAAFIDSLAEKGVVVLGGPLGDPDYWPALLVVAAGSEEDVRKHLADDPWLGTILEIDGVQRWSIWIGTLPGD